MKIRFQADADLNEAIVTGVRRRVPEIDFQTATEAGIEGLSDAGVLMLCSRQGRVLITHDRRTMPRHFADHISAEESPGVFIVQRSAELLVVIEELILVWSVAEAEEYRNLICTIPL